MPLPNSADLAVSTFVACSYASEACGSNGLPLTPNSICILGRFQVLKSLKHPNLCEYVDIVRGKHERLYVVSENYQKNLEDYLNKNSILNDIDIIKIVYQLLHSLLYLNKSGIVHRCLSPSNIQLTEENDVKLARYGFYHMTNYGSSVSFPICEPKYATPEVIALLLKSKICDESSSGDGSGIKPSGPKVDIWSIGIIIIELYLGHHIWKGLNVHQIIFKILTNIHKGSSILESIFKDENAIERLEEMPSDLRTILESCLVVNPLERLNPAKLLELPVFESCKLKYNVDVTVENFLSGKLRCRNLEIPEPVTKDFEKVDHLRERSLSEIYYLWKLVEGDVEAEYRRQGTIKTLPPVCTLPNLVLEECQCFGEKRDRSFLLDNKTVILTLDQLKQRLENVMTEDFYPLIENSLSTLPKTQSSMELATVSKLPLVIREKDVEYQLHRLVLFKRLLDSYPYKRSHIMKEAKKDIPPLYRAKIWAALLGVCGEVQKTYDSIDKETLTSTDRQIEVDIPRCHQYDELLSSPTGHAKFKRILKAWVVSHPQYVYWQGLDSLCAPFLYLNFHDEALAYACLSAFIPKYLHNFFMKDNSAIIQEYLAVFSHLIAFHDPELTNHLDSIGFIPELYAIPWFLTMYTHVFPLSKIFHLWDTLLLGNPSFPLCIAVAILYQLRLNLLSFGFNECILLFSDMPEIDIEKCVSDSIKFFCSMPKSVAYRQHENRDQKSVCSRVIPTLSSQQNVEDCKEESLKLDLGMDPLPLEVLKTEICPRISAEDLLNLLGIIPGSLVKQPKVTVVVVDVRVSDEFNRGTIPGSLNIPFQTAFNADGKLNVSSEATSLNSRKGKLVVIVGNRGSNASNFASKLVKLEFPKVCVLHKGIDVLRPAGVLVVPSAS